jgi:hypothetical protein
MRKTADPATEPDNPDTCGGAHARLPLARRLSFALGLPVPIALIVELKPRVPSGIRDGELLRNREDIRLLLLR